MGRIHNQGGGHPTSWEQFRNYGPTGSRFDHQPPPATLHPRRAILYAAPAHATRRRVPAVPVLRTCVLESFQGRRAIELTRDDPYFVLFRLERDIRLLDVADSGWVARAGGNAAISSGLRSASRNWSRSIYAVYPDLDGIFYTCSLDPSARSVALYERAEDALPMRPAAHLPLSHAALRPELETYAMQYELPLIP